MSKEPVLVVLAAGMGSRYGGLKQIDPVGGHGEAILDYSLFDAYEAGFRRAVILIKEAIREQSRGVCNANTEYHDRIINLVNSNINLIRLRMKAA